MWIKWCNSVCNNDNDHEQMKIERMKKTNMKYLNQIYVVKSYVVDRNTYYHILILMQLQMFTCLKLCKSILTMEILNIEKDQNCWSVKFHVVKWLEGAKALKSIPQILLSLFIFHKSKVKIILHW